MTSPLPKTPQRIAAMTPGLQPTPQGGPARRNSRQLSTTVRRHKGAAHRARELEWLRRRTRE
eukprot:1711814-Alexandrium_andersonii.AAC.1